jgi:hypothetical protein
MRHEKAQSFPNSPDFFVADPLLLVILYVTVARHPHSERFLSQTYSVVTLHASA